MIELIGIPSGDHEVATFDVPYREFIKIEGMAPADYNRSAFYKDLYRLYCVPTCKALSDYGHRDTLIRIQYDDYGIKSIKETDIPVIEDSRWCCEDDDNDIYDAVEDAYSAHLDIR